MTSLKPDALNLNSEATALILIDLQYDIVSRQLAPHSSSHVMQNASLLANALRSRGGTVIYVHCLMDEILNLPADLATNRDHQTPPSAKPFDIVPEAGLQPSDMIITKRQWGAFHATNLDQQLRRHRIDTILLGGIATNLGVESTARAAFDHGYPVVFVEDAMTSISAEAHVFSIGNIFPRMGRVRSTAQVLEALSG